MIQQDKEWICNNESFKNPHSFGNKLGRLVWNVVYVLLYKFTPPRLGMWWRRLVLLAFGARIGKSWIHPSTRIWAPWNLNIGNSVYVDQRCYLYNTFPITIKDRVIVSFGCVLCTPSHDYLQPDYPLIGGPIEIESDSWLMAESFVCPGVRIGIGGVVAARSVVTKDVKSLTVVAGSPAKFIKSRKSNSE